VNITRRCGEVISTHCNAHRNEAVVEKMGRGSEKKRRNEKCIKITNNRI
jgi:hypothetical protein